MSASTPDICGIDVQELYLHDPGNKQEPVGYVLCSEMGNTCMKNACSCRSAAFAEVNGKTKYFGVCVVLNKGQDCATSGDDYLTCAVSSQSSDTPQPESQNEATSGTTTKATIESNPTPGADISESSASGDMAISNTATSAASMSTTVMVVIIVVAVLIVSLISWFVRSYCTRRSSTDRKLASRRDRSNQNTSFDATSPTYMTGRSSATPSFPAFDPRTRGAQSNTSGSHGGRGGRNTPRAHETVSSRGRKNQDIDAQFAPGGIRDVPNEPQSGRRNLDANVPFPPLGQRREPSSGRGGRNPDTDASFPPLGPRREPISGRGRHNPRLDDQLATDMFRGAQREPTSGRSRPASNKGVDSSGGTVYAGPNTFERAAQFAQLAAFEAPPPHRPHRPIKAVPMANPVTKSARIPPSSHPVENHPNYHIPDDSSPTDYDILSPKTARSLAPSIASSAATVVAAGRNRPTPLQQNRRPQYQKNPPSYYQSGKSRDGNKYAETMGLTDSTFDDSKYEESDYGDSRFEESAYEKKYKATSNYEDSFVSEVSSMAWSNASGLSEDGYYHAVPSSMARIPVIEAPQDDDDTYSTDGYSDWGQQSANVFSSTAGSDASFFAASDASFFSVKSDFNESKSDMKEREF
ncbi:uncharacterized protein PHALS_05938 [Plasmopara halstedii]|uniref:Uncharacterized protein n=1 Tax=Plasmopara halstedii TaxID=4781 RepID=A0A0P1AAJ1_PLAHL|nr:uncharacterized protein PHALS_05938 [Plasmopara halstedii]CEG37889.1 hypothetical protein PHALS_05938 [Plasmopara halstedii]|eukprot:XP_024574258.1 hypothetical protein PHALS_05938 [Plasmopara halstedii]